MGMEACYPCGVHGYECVVEVSPRKRVAVVCIPLRGWFDVALWLWWPGALFPVCVGEVKASSAFEALERVMVAYRLRRVAYASVAACDGSLKYRAYWVQLS
jgi:hypothetical protein